MSIRNEVLLNRLAAKTQEYREIKDEYEAAWWDYIDAGLDCDKLEAQNGKGA